MEKRDRKNGMTELVCDSAHVLHRVGSEEYPEIRRAIVPTDSVGKYEEVLMEDIPPYTAAEYKAKVVSLIRERYDADDEMAILRQRSSKANEYAAYNTFVEGCKARARDELAMRNEEAGISN